LNIIFGAEGWLSPSISAATAGAIRVSCGLLMLLTLLRLVPHARRYFMSERWGGYGEAGWRVDLLQNPVVMPALMAAWIAATIGLITDRAVIAAAAINLACCYYFFTAMRWRGVLRGMGAPGFIACWLAAAVFLIEVTRRHLPQTTPLALLVLQIDFALIMIAAGIYKFYAGYRHANGMELGMVNPEWGYWWRWWAAVSPRHPVFRLFNELAWATEVVAGVLMLIPAMRFSGGMLILLSFIFIATQIRLGYLCEMVIVCTFIYFHPGSAGDRLLTAIMPAMAVPPVAAWPDAVATVANAALWSYLILLPAARVGLSYNLHMKKALPGVLQPLLEVYTNAFGMILWRVFSADHTNFFVRIYEVTARGDRRLISHWTEHRRYHARFNQVAEAIVVTTLFTSLKYYPSNTRLFIDRMLRYSRTLSVAPGSRLLFEHVRVVKREDRSDFVTAAEFVVDVPAGTVTETVIDPSLPVRAAISGSPLHEGARPGSYVPLKS
jgi:hypothetical protein